MPSGSIVALRLSYAFGDCILSTADEGTGEIREGGGGYLERVNGLIFRIGNWGTLTPPKRLRCV